MSNEERRRRNAKGLKRIVFFIFLAAMLVLLALRIMAYERTKYPSNDELRPIELPALETPSPTEAPKRNYGVSLPVVLEEDAIILTAIQASDVLNPDCGNRVGKMVGNIEITNCSEKHLSSATIMLKLETGEALVFTVKDIPAGRSVRVFESSNASLPAGAVVMAISCDTNFRDETPVMPESFEITTDGIKVTVKNISDGGYSNIKVSFHTLYDAEAGIYYGGSTVSKIIDNLPYMESVTFEMPDCYMGTPEAVRISQAA